MERNENFCKAMKLLLDNPVFELIIEESDSVMILLDSQFNIIFFNKKSLDFFSYCSEDFKQLNFQDLLLPESKIKFSKCISDLDSTSSATFFATFDCGNKIQYDSHVEFKSVTYEEQRVFLAKIDSDNTLKAINNKYSLEKERYKHFEQVCDEITWETDENMTFVYFSERIRDLLGFDADEFEGNNFFEIFQNEDNKKSYSSLKEIIRQRKKINNAELVIYTNKGEMIPISILASPYYSTDGSFSGYRGIFKDISSEYFLALEMKSLKHELELRVIERTSQLEQALEKLKFENEQRKKAQTELIKINKELEDSRVEIVKESRKLLELNEKLATSEKNLRDANAAKDKFFSIIAHDLKNPLQSMILSSYLLVQNFKNMPHDKLEFQINTINNATNHLHNLLDNLLHWARSQSGKMEFSPENINLIYLAKETIALVKPAADEKDINITADVDENIVVFVDSYMINTVLRNLLTNAIKFTRNNGKICIRAIKIENLVQIEIEDNGIGMTPDIVHRLFKIDYHHTTKGTNNEKGTGLGLILCKEFVSINGGRISVETNIGEGSIFKYTVPHGKDEQYQ